MNQFWGRVGSTWGLVGVAGLLGFAIYRLAGVTIDAFNYPFEWYHWTVLVANVLFMAFTEGYRGFQQSFSPKVVLRARDLAATPRLLPVLLAPLYCMHYFDSTRPQLIVTYALTVMIALLIVVFHLLSQPWRGILDAGVVVGLSWGLISILVLATITQAGKPAATTPIT